MVVLKLNELLVVYCTMHIAERKGTDWINRHSPYCEGWFSSLRSLGRITFVGYFVIGFFEKEIGLCIGSLSSLLYKTVQGESHLAKFNSLNSFLERREREDTALTFDHSLAFHPFFGLHDPMVGTLDNSK